VEVYFSQHIEDHYSSSGKLIKGVRKPKGQKETRRTLEAVVGKGESHSVFGKRSAVEITHVDIKNLIGSIIAKGTNVQAGRVLSELNLAFFFVIGRPKPQKGVPQQEWQYYLPDEHLNPCMQAKQYFRQQRTKLSHTPERRVLDDAELKHFLEWLPASKFTVISKHALMIALLTGCGSGEAVNAKKDNFVRDGQFLLVVHDTRERIEDAYNTLHGESQQVTVHCA